MIALIVVGIICSFFMFEIWMSIVLIALSPFFILYFGCLFIAFVSKKITIDDESITVKKDKFGKIVRVLQHQVNVNFGDITNVFLSVGLNDSHNKPAVDLATPMPYIVLESKEKKHAVNVYYYSKKQIIDILNEIIQRAKAKGNLTNLVSGEKIYEKFEKKARK